MRSRLSWVVAVSMVSLLGGLGCAKRSRGSEPPPSVSAAPLSLALLGTEGGALTESDVFDRLFDSPEVSAAGSRLFDRLASEPSLAPRYDELLARLFGNPAMLAAFARLAEPGASLDELTSTLLSRLSAGFEDPAFDAALDGAIDRLFDRPAVDAAFERLAVALIERARFSERLAALLLEWQPDLEAAIGVPMTDERFSARLEQHLAEPTRASALQQLLADRMVDDRGVRAGLAALLDDEAFLRACTSAVGTMLDGPTFHDDAALVLAGLIDGLDGAELGSRVDRVLVTPAMEAVVIAWLDGVTASPAFDGFCEQLGLVLEDPNVRAELLAIVVGVPAHQTA